MTFKHFVNGQYVGVRHVATGNVYFTTKNGGLFVQNEHGVIKQLCGYCQFNGKNSRSVAYFVKKYYLMGD